MKLSELVRGYIDLKIKGEPKLANGLAMMQIGKENKATLISWRS